MAGNLGSGLKISSPRVSLQISWNSISAVRGYVSFRDMGDRLSVHPEPALARDAADLQPDALAAPRLGNRHPLAVAADAHVLVADRLLVIVAKDVPALSLAGAADALRLPAAGNLDAK